MTDRDDLLRRVRRANPAPPEGALPAEVADSRPPVAWLIEGKHAMADAAPSAERHRWRGPAIAAAALGAALLIATPLWLLWGGKGSSTPVTSGTVAPTTTAPSTGRPLAPTGIDVVASSHEAYWSLVGEASGIIWVSSPGQLTRFDPTTEETRVWTVADDAAFVGDWDWDITPARAGGVWLFGGGTTVTRFDGERLEKMIEPPGTVIDLTEAADGALWAVVEATGVLRWDGSAWVATGITQVSPNTLVVSDDRGGVWVKHGAQVGVAPEGVGLRHYSGETWVAYTEAELGIDPSTVSVIAPQPDGTVWVGTSRGSLRHLVGGTWTGIDNEDPPFPGFTLFSMAVGGDGTMWAAFASEGTGAVRVVSIEGDTWTTYGAEEGLPGPADRGMVPVDLVASGGRVFLSTGSALLELVEDRWVQVLPDAPPIGPGSLDVMLAVSGEELFGVEGGVGLWHYRDGDWHLFTPADGLPADADFRTLVAGPEATIWAAGPGGVAYFDQGRWVLIDEQSATAIASGPDGTVWVGRGDGLADEGEPEQLVALERSGDTWAVSRVEEHPFGWADVLEVGSDGSLWLASHGGSFFLGESGLARFDGRRWEPIERLPGDFSSDFVFTVTDIEISPNGDIWVLATEGQGDLYWLPPLLARYDGRTWTSYEDRADTDGDPLEPGTEALCFDDQGTLYLPGANGGIATFDGEHWATLYDGDHFRLSVAPDGTIWSVQPPGVLRYPAG